MHLELLFCSCISLFIYYVRQWIKWSKLPPGPFGVPLLGYLPFMGKDHHLTLSRLSKKFGGIFSLRLGLEDVVVLTDWKSIKEGLNNPHLLGRPQAQFGTFLDDFKNHGLIDGPEWKTRRRLSVRILHELGFARQTMEDNIKDEIKYLLLEIDKSCGKPMDVGYLLSASASNNIAYFLFGHRYDYQDPVRKRLNKAFAAFVKGNPILSPLNFFKGLVKLIIWFEPPIVEQVVEGLRFVRDVTNAEIHHHGENLRQEAPSIAKDFIEGCLIERSKGTNISDSVILGEVWAFFAAGSDTVMVTIKWLLLLSVAYPDVQRKVQKEIDKVVGSDRGPAFGDRTLMPYTQAVISETLRWVSITPINLLRRAMSDTTVGGIFIPKDTTVVVNFWAAHNDETVWTNPQNFDPSRFLSENGKELKKIEAVIPFSMGKRSCSGEIMARCELFLYCTMILQRYEVSVANGRKVSLKKVLQLSMVPEESPVFVFTKRT